MRVSLWGSSGPGTVRVRTIDLTEDVRGGLLTSLLLLEPLGSLCGQGTRPQCDSSVSLAISTLRFSYPRPQPVPRPHPHSAFTVLQTPGSLTLSS